MQKRYWKWNTCPSVDAPFEEWLNHGRRMLSMLSCCCCWSNEGPVVSVKAWKSCWLKCFQKPSSMALEVLKPLQWFSTLFFSQCCHISSSFLTWISWFLLKPPVDAQKRLAFDPPKLHFWRMVQRQHKWNPWVYWGTKSRQGNCHTNSLPLISL